VVNREWAGTIARALSLSVSKGWRHALGYSQEPDSPARFALTTTPVLYFIGGTFERFHPFPGKRGSDA